MAGNLTERRKKVLQQSKTARDQDKLYPWEVNQGTTQKGYGEDTPFWKQSQNIVQENDNTRQSRMYHLQHDREVMDARERDRKEREEREKDPRKMREYEQQKKESEQRRKKQFEIADRLLKKKSR